MNAELQRQHAAYLQRKTKFWTKVPPPPEVVVDPEPEPEPEIETTLEAPPPPAGRCTNAELATARFVMLQSGPTIRSIAKATAAYFESPIEEVFMRRRTPRVVRVRQTAMAIMKSRTNMSVSEIGRRFGGFDHTTVLNAVRRADRDAVAAICLLLDEVGG